MQFVILSKYKNIDFDKWKVVSKYQGASMGGAALCDLNYHNNNSILKKYILIKIDDLNDTLEGLV